MRSMEARRLSESLLPWSSTEYIHWRIPKAVSMRMLRLDWLVRRTVQTP